MFLNYSIFQNIMIFVVRQYNSGCFLMRKPPRVVIEDRPAAGAGVFGGRAHARCLLETQPPARFSVWRPTSAQSQTLKSIFSYEPLCDSPLCHDRPSADFQNERAREVCPARAQNGRKREGRYRAGRGRLCRRRSGRRPHQAARRPARARTMRFSFSASPRTSPRT